MARALGMALVAALAFTGTGAAAVYLQSKASIDVLDIADLITPVAEQTPVDPSDPFAGRELNILVMGTDYRDEENVAIAGTDDGGMRSDTTFIMHISADRSWVEIISLPRDALVSIPSCQQPDGTMSKPRKSAMFNSAFDTGAGTEEDPDTALTHAAACTYQTVLELTGIPLTNFMVLKMTGVMGVVDALGGVEMCFDEPVVGNKKYSPDLDLPSGRYRLDGREAIAFVRARKGKGMGLEEGSDLERILRQQAFIDSALAQLISGDILKDTPRLYQVLQETLKSVATDKGLGDFMADAGLAISLRGLDSSRIVFTDLEVATAPSNANRVVFTSISKEIWARIALDQPPEVLAPVPTEPEVGGGEGTGGGDGGTGIETGVDTGTGGVDPGIDPGAGTDAGTGGTETVPVVPEYLPGVCYDGWVPTVS